MREVCFLLIDECILRAYTGSAAHIPDSRDRWENIWKHREQITEIVHTHPGDSLAFSNEDLTTMEAVEAGAGRSFTWSIVTARGFISQRDGKRTDRNDAPWWLSLIRSLSEMETTENSTQEA